MIPHMRVMQFRRIHDDWVRQVAFYSSLNCIISIANTSKQSMYISDMSQKTIYSFNIAKVSFLIPFIQARTVHQKAREGQHKSSRWTRKN